LRWASDLSISKQGNHLKIRIKLYKKNHLPNKDKARLVLRNHKKNQVFVPFYRHQNEGMGKSYGVKKDYKSSKVVIH